MTAEAPVTLHLKGISLTFRATGAALIENVTLSIAPGEIVTLMGPSGSGKSTLLAYAGGFLDHRAFSATGMVMLGDDRLDDKPAAARRLGILFQDPVLFPHLSVSGNLLFGLPPHPHRGRQNRKTLVDAALARAGLGGFASRDPATLSSGQKTRVALLRTLLAKPRALLLDESFGKLDTALRSDMREMVFGVARERQLPTLLVTHDPIDAIAAGGRVYALKDTGLQAVSAMETQQ